MKEIKQNILRAGPFLICLGIGAGLWFMPHSATIDLKGWHLLSVFIATIVALLIKPLPMGATAVISTTILLLTNTLTLTQGLSGFSNSVVWLLVLALFIAHGFLATGLGNRVAYVFTFLLGKHSLGLSYGLATADLIMSPAIPSVTGRVGGIIFPILQSISTAYGSEQNVISGKKLGGFLTLCAYQVTVITSTMFLTAMAANPLLQSLSIQNGLKITWSSWALAASVPGMLSLLLMPLIVYKLYPPEIKDTPLAPAIAKQKLQEMGPLSRKEYIMIGTIFILLGLWIFGGLLNVTPVAAAFVGVSILLITNAIKWESLLKEPGTWETFVWFALLLMMAGFLNDFKVISAFSTMITGHISAGIDWRIAFPALALFYFYSHYFFASSTAHVAAMYVPVLVLALGLGTPPELAMYSLVFASILFGGLTHYGLSPAPILFGAGYVTIGTWWRVCFVASLANITIWGGIGALWWKFLGLW
jgi:DASS family divalent anion:Na+ symporter